LVLRTRSSRDRRCAAPGYDAELYAILQAGDWQQLREFTRRYNAVSDDVYAQPQHFWEVMMHKLICNRFDLVEQHHASRTWLADNGYTSDLGGY
jgi:hypothetical protein